MNASLGPERACDPLNEFRCENGLCIPLDYYCDFQDDCHDLSDETNCRKTRRLKRLTGIKRIRWSF